ncbi:MAG: hypothetical protein HY537_18645 [Deltaproteobacteria bacterium]|nr:hypothetical protein [Deltaproteobacteria bacterium]
MKNVFSFVLLFLFCIPAMAGSLTMRCKNSTGENQFGNRLILNALYVVQSMTSSKFNKFRSSYITISGVYRTVLYYEFANPNENEAFNRVAPGSIVDIAFVANGSPRPSDLSWIEIDKTITPTSNCTIVQ